MLRPSLTRWTRSTRHRMGRCAPSRTPPKRLLWNGGAGRPLASPLRRPHVQPPCALLFRTLDSPRSLLSRWRRDQGGERAWRLPDARHCPAVLQCVQQPHLGVPGSVCKMRMVHGAERGVRNPSSEHWPAACARRRRRLASLRAAHARPELSLARASSTSPLLATVHSSGTVDFSHETRGSKRMN